MDLVGSHVHPIYVDGGIVSPITLWRGGHYGIGLHGWSMLGCERFFGRERFQFVVRHIGSMAV
jgi:hypothetical protein